MPTRPLRRRSRRRASPRVMLGFGWPNGLSRRIMQGVVRYAAEFGPWDFVHEAYWRERHSNPTWIGPVDGIIAEAVLPATYNELRDSGIPAVALQCGSRQRGLPSVIEDEHATARVALDHLRSLGVIHIAYATHANETDRRDPFVQAVSQAGLVCHVFPTPHGRPAASLPEHIRAVGRWLAKLPKPVGVFCHDMTIARDVTAAAVQSGVHVPSQAAVLGFGGDDFTSGMCVPPVSTVEIPGEEMGYAAARLLHRRMSGEQVDEVIAIAPTGVVARASTDSVAAADPSVAGVLRALRERFASPVRVTELADEAAVSRRALEAKFRRVVGRSIHDELTRLRIDHAKRLLIDTDDTLDAIAPKCGFEHASRFATVFREKVGLTPRRYRIAHSRPRVALAAPSTTFGQG